MIDRENVISKIKTICEICKENKWMTEFTSDVIYPILSDALAIVKEHKEGKWIEQIDYLGDTYYDCSVCNESWTTIDGTPWQNGMNYCPHCGSKMKLEQS